MPLARQATWEQNGLRFHRRKENSMDWRAIITGVDPEDERTSVRLSGLGRGSAGTATAGAHRRFSLRD